jgi:hypothetical protein
MGLPVEHVDIRMRVEDVRRAAARSLIVHISEFSHPITSPGGTREPFVDGVGLAGVTFDDRGQPLGVLTQHCWRAVRAAAVEDEILQALDGLRQDAVDRGG